MAAKSSFIPLKVLVSYLLIATLVIAVGFMLFKENKLFSNYENQSVEENQKLIRLGTLISKIYDVDNLGRIAIQSNLEKDFELYGEENKLLITEIDSFGLQMDNEKQVVLLDSLKIILHQKVSNIEELKKINKSQNTYFTIDNALSDLTRIEESMGKITLEGLNVDPTKLTTYERRVYQEYVDYLNANVPKESASTLTDKEIDSILVSSKKILENVRVNSQAKTASQKNKEIELLRNDLFISQKLNEILVEFESDVIKKANLNNLSREKVQQKTVSILTTAAIIGLVMTGLFFLLITNDFLKNQRYRKQLEIEKKKTESLLTAREQLIATVSHDLKTPLNTIQGFSELISIGGVSEKQNYYLSNIKSSSIYINQLVNDLLDFSKIEAGKIELENTSFELDKLIVEVAESIQTLHTSKPISLQFELDSIANLSLESDALRIRQILSNLIGNAYKFTEKGYIKIKAIYTENQLTIVVEDSGIGIESSKLNLIFNEFTQADKSIEKKYGGTGLGLTICKKLAEILRGNLTVESEVNKGSTFTLTLPALMSENKKEIQVLSEKENKKINIAVVDDDNSLLQLTTEFLKIYNFSVISFDDPERLINSLKTRDYDAIITDIQMPKMSGFELLNQIPKEIPVVAITGQRDMNKNIYLEKGFSSVLHKPYRSEELLAVLSTILKINIAAKHDSVENSEIVSKEYNLKNLKSMLDNDKTAITEVVKAFIENTTSNIAIIEESLLNSDKKNIAAISHRMLPMTKQLEAKEIIPLLEQLEECEKTALSDDQMKIILDKIKEKAILLAALLQKELIL
ncbi:hybrid sensor histidine kinase/response regulator [Flavobacterium orientale]|uniref:histidine kinase n=1 Tax=Flavobacterium orientale TaxID=1756020 RepID=A0A916XZ26_9FLAO|nr:ATP-binding protein [Flavobacterium orientale]GGD20792.1 hybrid sensor histidine kinase/response regulator [Flavobacterium orientale]